MTDLLTSIQTQFNNTSSLTTIFKKLWLSAGPNGYKPTPGNPLCVLVWVSAVPEFQTVGQGGTKTCLTRAHVQFSVFAASDSEAIAGIEAIKTAFDFASLTMTSSQCVSFRRANEQIMKEDEKVWHAFVEYEVWIGEAP